MACMEDILDLYREACDPDSHVICLDEMPVELFSHAQAPTPMRKGRPAREDSQYVRGGLANVFGALDFKGGRRLFEVTRERKGHDFAHFLRRVVDELCAGASKIRLVLDNLNIHSRAALYRTFAPEEARRIARKVEFHFTPKHGSWLNAVELEFAAARKQCLGTRPGDYEDLEKALKAWQDERNEKKARVRWTFDTETARGKLKRIYPTNEP